MAVDFDATFATGSPPIQFADYTPNVGSRIGAAFPAVGNGFTIDPSGEMWGGNVGAPFLSQQEIGRAGAVPGPANLNNDVTFTLEDRGGGGTEVQVVVALRAAGGDSAMIRITATTIEICHSNLDPLAGGVGTASYTLVDGDEMEVRYTQEATIGDDTDVLEVLQNDVPLVSLVNPFEIAFADSFPKPTDVADYRILLRYTGVGSATTGLRFTRVTVNSAAGGGGSMVLSDIAVTNRLSNSFDLASTITGATGTVAWQWKRRRVIGGVPDSWSDQGSAGSGTSATLSPSALARPALWQYKLTATDDFGPVDSAVLTIMSYAVKVAVLSSSLGTDTGAGGPFVDSNYPHQMQLIVGAENEDGILVVNKSVDGDSMQGSIWRIEHSYDFPTGTTHQSVADEVEDGVEMVAVTDLSISSDIYANSVDSVGSGLPADGPNGTDYPGFPGDVGNQTPQDFCDRFDSGVALLKTVGYDRVCAMTGVVRIAGTPPDSQVATQNTVNEHIRSTYLEMGADELIDRAKDGRTKDASNATYYVDGVHFTAAHKKFVAEWSMNAVLSAIEGGTAPGGVVSHYF